MTSIMLDPDEFGPVCSLMHSAAVTFGDSALDASELASCCCAPTAVQGWVDDEAASLRSELSTLRDELHTEAQGLASRGAVVAGEATLPAVVARTDTGYVVTTAPNDPNVVIAWDPSQPGTVLAWNRNRPDQVVALRGGTIVGFDARDPARTATLFSPAPEAPSPGMTVGLTNATNDTMDYAWLYSTVGARTEADIAWLHSVSASTAGHDPGGAFLNPIEAPLTGMAARGILPGRPDLLVPRALLLRVVTMTTIMLDPLEFEPACSLMRSAAVMFGDAALDASELASCCCAPAAVQGWVDDEAASLRSELSTLRDELHTEAQGLASRGAAVAGEATLPAVVANANTGLVTTTDPNDPNIVIAWDPNNPGTVAVWNRNNPTFVMGWNTSDPNTIVGFDTRNPAQGVAYSQSTGNAFVFGQGAAANGGVTEAIVGGTTVGGSFAPTPGGLPPTIATVGGSWSTTSTDAGFSLPDIPAPVGYPRGALGPGNDWAQPTADRLGVRTTTDVTYQAGRAAILERLRTWGPAECVPRTRGRGPVRRAATDEGSL